jgi:hypothetical protein
MRNLLQDFEAEEAILDRVEALLRSRVGEGKPLTDIASAQSVNRGDTSAARVELNRVWIGDAETSAVEANPLRYEDNRAMEVILQAEVREKEATRGPKKARRLALAAGSQLTRDDAGNEDLHLGIPQTVVSVEFRRSFKIPLPSDRDGGIYSHASVYRIKYRAQR